MHEHGHPPRVGDLSAGLPVLRTAKPSSVCAERPAPRLLDQVRRQVRVLHYSLRTEQAYVYWCKAFIRFHELRHPLQMGGDEVSAFLSHLAVERQVAPSTHRQALSALLFLDGKVLGQQLPWMDDIGRPVPKRRLPVVLSREEVGEVLSRLTGTHQLLAQLLYGTGLRISEALQLRVKDLDFGQGALYVRSGKGDKDRVVMLPKVLVPGLCQQLAEVREIWLSDVSARQAGVEMPHALDRKYPREGQSLAWFWVFPQDHHSVDPRSGVVRRHHLYDLKVGGAGARSPLDSLMLP